MTALPPGPFEHTPIAYNFASESSNKIHDDATARRFGFAGGLVPGVASYAYLAAPALDALGDRWLADGGATVKLIRPVYEGDRVTARATPERGDPRRGVRLELLDGGGQRCAEGRAWIGDAGAEDDLPTVGLDDTPRAELPSLEDRPPANLQTLREGTVLGSLAIGPWDRQELAAVAEQYRDPSPRYGPDAERPTLHPAHLLHEANQILVRNVLLGPWIHVGSRVRHLRRVDCSRSHRLRGTVEKAVEHRGHEIVTLALALSDDRGPVAAIRHTAIIRPRQAVAAGAQSDGD